MPQCCTASIVDHCGALEEPRIERHKHPQLLEVSVMAICAIVCGADDWVAIETCGHAKEAWFRRFLALPNGIPSHDTFGRSVRCSPPAACRTVLWGGGKRERREWQGKGWRLTANPCAAPTLGARPRRRATWSVPGPRTIAWYGDH